MLAGKGHAEPNDEADKPPSILMALAVAIRRLTAAGFPAASWFSGN
jgi:hypothetical protein